jgi:hypothetical protein
MVSTSEADLAKARTVNSLAHLDLATYVRAAAGDDGEVGEKAHLDACGFGGDMLPLGDVTCMALVRDEHEPVKDVLLTGSLSGWVHCWSHGQHDPNGAGGAGGQEDGEPGEPMSSARSM